MLRYANPGRFLQIGGALLPWLAGVTAVLLAAGLFLALSVPPDIRQGETVRIMFVHVPAAWVAMMAYGLMAIAAAAGLISRHPLAGAAMRAAAPLGAAFTALGLITGALWGRPMWGAFWVWDGRLTSFLLLLFLYLGVIALQNAIEDEARAARLGAILAVAGAVNLPVIHFSVQWWTTLHQRSSILASGGPSMAPVYLWPLLAMVCGYTGLFLVLWVIRIRTMILERRARKWNPVSRENAAKTKNRERRTDFT